jgi:hypothetical protein
VILAPFVPLDLEGFARCRYRAHRLIVAIPKWKSARRLFPVAEIDPKLGVKAAAAKVEAGDSAIARIARGDKLGPMIGRGKIWIGHCARTYLVCQRERFGFALRCTSFHNITLAQTLAQS